MSGSVLDRMRILLVEDHAELRGLMRAMLGEIGFTNVEAAAEGGEAYRRFVKRPAALVITDLRMAPLDGLSLVRMIRTAPESPNRTVPIMVLSGDAALESVRAARDAGATDFLARPFSTDTLFTHLCRILRKPQPFVETSSYVGPSRRRRPPNPPGEERRRFVW
jgi:CheY-like chemotaxis protein